MDERLSHPKRSWCVTAAFRGGPGGRPGVIQRESQATVIGLQPTSVPSLILPPPPPPSGHRLQLLDSRARVCLRLSLAAARPHVVRKDDERVHEELDCLLLVSHDVQTKLQGSPRHPRATDSSRAPHRPVPTRESDPCPASPSGRRTHGAAPPPWMRARRCSSSSLAPGSSASPASTRRSRASGAPVVSVCSARARPSSRSRNPSRSN